MYLSDSLYVQYTFIFKSRFKMKKTAFFLIGMASMGCTTAWASDSENTFNSALNQRFTVYGGAQFYQAEGDFSSTKDGWPKYTVDLDDLGLDENEISPIFGAIFNLGKRWTLRFDYFGYHDDANTTAEFDFIFDDETVTAGADIDSSLDLDLYVINIAYNFYSTERAYFGVGLGVHIADIDLQVSGEGTSQGVVIGDESERINYTAPLPNLYIGGAYAFTETLLMKYSAGWMSLQYNDYDGELLFGNVALEYWPYEHAGLGIGYRYTKVDIDYDPGKKKEKYDVKLPGPMVYAVFGF